MNSDKDKIKANLEEVKNKLDEIKKLKSKMVADTIIVSDEDESFDYEGAYNSLISAMEYLDYRFSNIYNYISSLESALYRHLDNHLPAPSNPEEMQRAIDALGLQNSYTVEKRVIYASNGKRLGLNISIRNK